MTTTTTSATKHSLSSIQRQYIDARISELTSEKLRQLANADEHFSSQLSSIFSQLQLHSDQIFTIEGRLNSDDRYSMTKARLVEFMKNMGWYDGDKS